MIKYEGVSLNVELIRGMTLDQFINHRSYQHFWPWISLENKKKRLIELYQLCAL